MVSEVRPTRKPTIALVATGGTIASIGHDRLDYAFYGETETWVDVDALLERIPEIHELATIKPIPFARLGSSSLTTPHWLDLARTVNALLNDDEVDGVVITHGTNTIEETAYFLSLVTPPTKPTVITGAMRPLSALSFDGDLNLIQAVWVASSASMRGHGTVVCLNGQVFDAKHVTKGHTHRPDTFTSGSRGPIALVDPTGAVIVQSPPATNTAPEPAQFDIGDHTDLPRVHIALSYACIDGAIIRAMVADGAQGIVSAGTGAGKPSPDERFALAEAIEHGVSVVQSTRVGDGWVVESEPLREEGIVASRDLLPWKARILLMLALTAAVRPSRDEFQALFDAA